MCVKLSPGTAYVRGFDVNLPGTTVLDVDKPRDVKDVPSASIPFSMGSLLRLNNVQGTPYINLGGNSTNIVGLYNQRRSGSTSLPTGIKIGQARVYSFGVSDTPYENASTEFDLHLYDIQTYTTLKITNVASQPKGTRVRGLSSGAIGYLAEISGTSAADEINISETTGTFVVGEQLIYKPQTGQSAIGIAATTVPGIGVTNLLPPTVFATKEDNDLIKVAVAKSFADAGVSVSFTNISGIGTNHTLSVPSKDATIRTLISIDNIIQSPVGICLLYTSPSPRDS